MYWNSYFRFIVEGTLEIFISAGINIRYLMLSGANPFDSTQGGWQFRIMNTLSVVGLTLIIVISPFFVVYFYIKNKHKWMISKEDTREQKEVKEKFEERFGDILEGVNKAKLSSLAYIVIFLLRRITMTLIVVLPHLEIQWF